MKPPYRSTASSTRLDSSTRTDLPVSCGTLVFNDKGELLLCHVTGHHLWDLPKGMQEAGEPAVKTAKRELHEETGLEFTEELFIEIGRFDFRPDKRLHLFKVHAPAEAQDIRQMHCTSHFVHPVTGKSTPEMDGFRWASRAEIPQLCGPNMQRVLLSIDW
jgi:putative (di)nucleoside polyphosphate hydrolase